MVSKVMPNTEKIPGSSYKLVPIQLLHPNPNNPRKKFDQESLDKLTESVKQVGILEPILCVKNMLDEWGSFELRIVAGERRWRAALAAGLQEVPVIVRELTEEQEFEVMLTENIQRQDLDPIEEAIAFKAAIDRGWKQVDLAAKLGISQELISNRMRLLKLPESVQENISRGILSAGHGLALVKVAHQPELVKNLMEKLNGVPVASAEKVIDDYIYNQNHFTPLCSGQGWRSPKFDPDKEGCAKCPDRVLIKTSANAEHRHPYCINRKCWEEKQQIAEEAEKEQKIREALGEDVPVADIPAMRDLGWGNFETFGRISIEACIPCEHIKDALDWDDNVTKVCMNPACMKEKLEAIRQAEAEKREAEAAAWVEEKKRLIADYMPGATIDTIDKNVLIFMAAKVVESADANYYGYGEDSIYEAVYDHFGWPLPTDEESCGGNGFMAPLIEKLKELDNLGLIRALYIALMWSIHREDEVYQLTLGAAAGERAGECFGSGN